MNFNEEHFPQGFVRLKAKTKKRQGLDGNLNRGLLIVSESGQERWLSITDASITELQIGAQLYFNGSGARPSLTIPQEYSQQHSSLGEAIANSYHAPQQQAVDFENNARAYANSQLMSKPVDTKYSSVTQSELNNNYTNQHQNSSSQIQSDINEQLLEKTCLVLSNAVNLISSLNPQLSEESLVKLAISAVISYQQQLKNIPF